MKHKISTLSQIIMVLCFILLIGTVFLPIWRIELSAPQYPEGLVLKIFSHKLGGQVDIVNGLNHYIGMRTLHENDFEEFAILPYILGGFAVLALLVAVIKRRWLLNTWFLLFLLFAVLAMVDFYRWEYAYGHDLDPSAPIVVPGMAYQPPLLGFKQLLNFGVYSVPDSGGWLLIAAGLLSFLIVIKEIRRGRRISSIKTAVAVGIVLTGLSLTSCRQGPAPLRLGQDACDFCKMTVTHPNYGAELITGKGKIYRFDDIACMFSFIPSGVIKESDIRDHYVVDFSTEGTLVKAEDAYFLKSDLIRGPMGGDIAAFANQDSLKKFQARYNGASLTWQELNK